MKKKSNRECSGEKSVVQLKRIMKLTFIFILVGCLTISAKTNAQKQKISLDLIDCSVVDFFKTLQENTQLYFIYNIKNFEKVGKLDVKASDEEVEQLLNRLFGEIADFNFMDNTVVVRPKKEVVLQQQGFTVQGIVTDEKNNPLPGVTIRLDGTTVGTSSDTNGKYSLTLPVEKGTLIFSFIGFKQKRIVFDGGETINVTLEEDVEEMEEVVVTGIFDRPVDSFTGSFSHFKREELKVVGGSNILQSLRTLDPAFHISLNNELGSNPNQLPDIDIRGKTSIAALEDEFGDNPNLPLCILDGFETNLETIMDLSTDMVSSITVLKDASASAIYGSKAANGVIVIETVKAEPGKLRLRYNGNYSIEIPDLTSYNMMNAAEKLEFEYLAGVYSNIYYWGLTTTDPDITLNMLEKYNQRLGWVKSGVNTYWLNEPVRTGFVHKHTIYIDGGYESLTYGLGIDYANTNGAMHKSNREVVGFNLDLRYRMDKFRFDNKFTVGYTNYNNPPVNFNVYVRTNPYYEKDYEGSTPPKFFEYEQIINHPSAFITRANPLYNESLKHIDNTNILSLKDNFQVEWLPIQNLNIKGRVNLTKTNTVTENFKSPFHTDFETKDKTERGSYTKGTSDLWSYKGEVIAHYSKSFTRHLITLNGGWNFSSSKSSSDSYKVIGFPDDLIPNPSFANKYDPDSKAPYNETIRRNTSFYLIANYSYDNKYLLDFNIREDGSSVYGMNKRFTNAWSLGVAWNVHKEFFTGDWLDRLKLRFSLGKLGNDNFSTYIVNTTYKYNTELQNLYGIGGYINKYGNPNLKWQKTMDYNLGFDFDAFNNRLIINTDFYKRITDPLILPIDIEPSTGRTKLYTNFGRKENKGLNFSIKAFVVKDVEREITWGIHFNGRHHKDKYSKFGDKLKSLNENLQNNYSLQRYYNGGSESDIWLVKSAGIDPMTGQEIYIKKDGSQSFVYTKSDEVLVGNTTPKLEGTFGTTFRYKKLDVAMYFRYRSGADKFNNELYERIENISDHSDYNQDKRALYDRWKQPGDIAQYSNITNRLRGNQVKINKTDRYLQKDNTLTGESLSVGYTFDQNAHWMKQMKIQSMSVRAIMRDIFYTSSIKAERGLFYPFARNINVSFNVVF